MDTAVQPVRSHGGSIPSCRLALAASFVALACLALLPATTEAQPAFEFAFGPQYGLQDPDRPLTRGWIVSSGFDLAGTSFVIEGSWHRDSHVDEHYWDFDEVYRRREQDRYWMLVGGIRAGQGRGRARLYYQFLAGGVSARFRTDHEWPASIDTEAENAACGIYFGDVLVEPCLNVPYPEFDEEHNTAFVVQPGMGVNVNVWRQLSLRLAADLPIFASRDYVVLWPRLSAQIVVTLGR